MLEKFAVYGGVNRRVYSITECKVCNMPVWSLRTYLDTAKYCSRECAYKSKIRNREELHCAKCSVQFSRTKKKRKNKSGIVFCSRTCKDASQGIDGLLIPGHYNNIGISNYRRRALKHYGRSCQKCSYSIDTKMLDVHHIDGNRRNNKIVNLAVLCVWCHALKTRGVV